MQSYEESRFCSHGFSTLYAARGSVRETGKESLCSFFLVVQFFLTVQMLFCICRLRG